MHLKTLIHGLVQGHSLALLFSIVSGCGNSNSDASPATSGTGGGTGLGGAAAVGGNTSSSSIGGESVEAGLCSLSMQCPKNIEDGIETLCRFDVTSSDGVLNYSDYASVEIRGRSSSKFPKKNYGIELQTSAGDEHPENLLELGKESDYVLDGAWADRSFMRNRLTYSLLREANPAIWTPRARYCELSLNGEYAGIYVLIERIKRDDDRVNLPEDSGSGSTFIVKQDEQGSLSLSIGSGDTWQLIYPREELATPIQRQAVQEWLDDLALALKQSPPTDILQLFDQAKVVDWILVEELAKNIDAFNLSLYFVRDSGGPTWVVPWDTDLAYGQPTLNNSTNDQPTGWVNTRTSLIRTLAATPEIHNALGSRFRQLRASVWSDAKIAAKIDAYASILTDSAIARNFELWPIEDVDFKPYYDPYTFYDVQSYAEEMTHFRSWITERLRFLDANIDNYPTK
jgi:hypothetical protein